MRTWRIKRHANHESGHCNNPDRPILPFLYIILALWAIHVFFIERLNFTGDEVRYVAYSLGIFNGQGFHPSDAIWQQMLGKMIKDFPIPVSPAGHSDPLIHSVAYPIMGSLAVFSHGLEGARWFSFMIATLGLMILFVALQKCFNQRTSFMAIISIAFACPLIFYMRLFFSEILLFFCNCMVVYFFLSNKHKNTRFAFWAALGFCFLPFIHVKLSMEAAIAYVILFISLRKYGMRPGRQVALLCMTACVFGLYLVYNYSLFGKAIGGGNPAFPMSLLAIPDRILVNLFDMRHGLITNAPHMLLSLIGLILAWRDNDPRIRILIALFSAYFFTMLWANGSEAYAARNWTAAMPFLALGFARWAHENTTINYVCAVPIFLLSFCLFCVTLKFPSAFLDSRNYSVPYDKLFETLPFLHFGYLLPYDFLDHEGAKLNASLALGLSILAVSSVYAWGQITARWTGLILQVLVLVTIVYFSLVEEVDSADMFITHDQEHYYADLKFDGPRHLAFIRLDNPHSEMKPYGFFHVDRPDRHTSVIDETRASRIVPVPFFTPVNEIRIVEFISPHAPIWLDSATNAVAFRRILGIPGLDD